MPADILAVCVARSSLAMVLIMHIENANILLFSKYDKG